MSRSRELSVTFRVISVSADSVRFKRDQAIGIAIADNMARGCTGKMRTDD